MTDVKHPAAKTDTSDALDHVIRGGLVAYGIIHILIGWLAVQVAFGEKAKQASGTGALEYLAKQPLGGVLIWVVALGMVALVIWRVIEAWDAFRTQDGSDQAKGIVSQLFKGVLYAALALSALQVALGQSGGGGGGGTDSMTADLMKATAGQLLVGAVGVGVLAYGAYYVYQGWSEKFLEKLDGRPVNAEVGKAYRWLGKAGFIAKGIAIGMIGVLFIYAAVTHDPKKSAGLDQALQEIVQQPYGQVLLTLVAAGIACSGLFAFARARHFDR